MKAKNSNEESPEEPEVNNEERCCSRQHWPFKLFYFFFIASYSCKCVFVPLFFKQLGLPAHYVGLLTGVAPFSSGAGAPILGYIADKTNSRKAMLLFSLVAQTITPLVCLIPRPNGYSCGPAQANYSRESLRNGHSNMTTDSGGPVWLANVTLKNQWQSNRTGQYETPGNLDASITNDVQVDFPTGKRLFDSDNVIRFDGIVDENEAWDIFVFLFVVLLIGEFLGGVIHNIADSSTVHALGENRSEYGRIFVFGNIGTVLAALFVTGMAHVLRFEVCGQFREDFQFSMYVMSASTALSFLAALKLAIPTWEEDEQREGGAEGEQRRRPRPNAKRSLDQFVFNFRNFTFLIVVFYLGIGIGTFYAFMFWYLTDMRTEGTALVIAIIMVLRNFALGAAFVMSGYVIRKLGSVNILNCSLVLMIAVFTSYAFLENAWWAIIPDVLHSLSFGLGWAASVTFCAERAPAALVATIQGLVEGLYKGIGYGLGPVVSGFLYNHLGGAATFLIFGGLSLIVLGFSFLSQLISRALEQKTKGLEYSPIPSNDDDDDGTNGTHGTMPVDEAASPTQDGGKFSENAKGLH